MKATATSRCVVIVDGRRASAFAVARDPSGRLKFTLMDELKNTHDGEHERHRADLLGGAERRGTLRASGAHAAAHSVAPHHTEEEEQVRFAREVTSWLERLTTKNPSSPTAIFAGPRQLGLLRGEHAKKHTAFHFLHGDFGNMGPSELALDPTIRNAVETLCSHS